MKSPNEIALERAQKCISDFPAVILGCGASAPYNLSGMSQLGQHLVSNIVPETSEQTVWSEFKSLLDSTNDLESSLQRASLSKHLVDKIVVETWNLIGSEDKLVLSRVLTNRKLLSLTRLFRCLLGSTNRSLRVITTNYDCLGEYAANAAGFYTNSGFGYGYFSCLDEGHPIQLTKNSRLVKVVEFSKVHGSLDWFLTNLDETICIPNLRELPSGWMPLIVTPGVSKYEKTSEEPFRSVIGRADLAMIESKAYLTIGYGFNDKHIQPKLLKGVRSDRKRLVVLARTLTDSTKAILLDGTIKDYLALEMDSELTKIYCPEYPDGARIDKAGLWDLPIFMDWATNY